MHACASPDVDDNNGNSLNGMLTSNQRIFRFRFENVWRATQLSLKYPIAINNMDNGVLETEWIKASDGFRPPTQTKEPSSGIRYKVTVNIVRGKVDRKDATRVTIYKKIEKHKDFFSEPESIDTDGLEEKVIFYRIERELWIDEGLKKAAMGETKTP